MALGGGVGSLARYGLAQNVHSAADAIPLATLLTNLLGSLLLGVLVVAVTEIWSPHPLLRPALGTGVLGGFTTYSTFAVQSRGLPLATSVGYVAASVLGGLGCAYLGMWTVRSCFGARPEPAPHASIQDDVDPDLP
ncbi:CrcB family protein [Jatrophihabitans sp. GAS493]|uniref:fluoride efflux transporter FluC n=1 Tax=Jatrophihabitans sp. GAS493 TaxID=1907575 RepID=UPI0018D59AE3|nr:CrcB family protein [Jatrophihabitans sp. GAS493]